MKKKKSSQFAKKAQDSAANYLEPWAEPNYVFESDDEEGNLENAVVQQRNDLKDSSDSDDSGMTPMYQPNESQQKKAGGIVVSKLRIS